MSGERSVRGFTVARRELRRRWLEARFSFVNRLGLGPTTVGGQSLVVSITTHERRLDRCYLAIESILAGDRRPESVVLWLSARERHLTVPQTLVRLVGRGLTIEYCSPDFGPANKLVHALRRYPDSTVVVADDDNLYPRRWLAALQQISEGHPSCIIAHACHTLLTDIHGSLLPYAESKRHDAPGSGPSHQLMPLGWGGVLFPPGSLDDVVHDHDLFIQLTPRNDDIWFKAAALVRAVPTVRVSTRNIADVVPVSRTQEDALAVQNVSVENDESLRRVIAHFGLETLIREA